MISQVDRSWHDLSQILCLAGMINQLAMKYTDD